MRIVRHPNIVELKAFYYSSGEAVSLELMKELQMDHSLTK